MISGLDGDATYMKYEPYDSKLYSGLGNEQNSFPFGKDVIFNVTLGIFFTYLIYTVVTHQLLFAASHFSGHLVVH